METLHTWWATELYPMRERDQFGVSGEFEVVLAADAQATIAALQARVQELEDGTSALLNQQSERLAVENEKLMMALSQLTQRTAELEAANTLLYKKNCALGRAETSINNLQAELERVRGELAEVAVLTKEIKDEFDGCTHECERCGESDPMITFDIYRTVVQLAALTATSQEGQG